jgi:hypothetical protein
MDDAVDAIERAGDDVFVANIADDQFGIVGEIVGPLAIAVDLLDQAVEHADLVAAPEQLLRNRPSNKASAARYEDCFPQRKSP